MRIDKVKFGVKDYLIAITYIDGATKKTLCTNTPLTYELKDALLDVTLRTGEMYNQKWNSQLLSVKFTPLQDKQTPKVVLAITNGVYLASLNATIKTGEEPTVSEVELLTAFDTLEGALINYLKECGNN